MKIAVTSASGALGATIINHLISEIGKENVMGLARTPKNAEHLGVEIRKGDYNKPEDLKESLLGVDAVLLVSGNDKPENRIQQHRNVIEAAQYCGVKKLVYTSVEGDGEHGFNAVVKSNRQTEEDLKNSGLNWAIGRNNIYIEPDLEYIPNYKKVGKISNSAGQGKCAYTSRAELAFAYTKLLLTDNFNGKVYHLGGKAISQQELTEAINTVFGTNLSYKTLSVDEYQKERVAELGAFYGLIIAGIYEAMNKGAFNTPSDYEKITGRPHQSPIEMMEAFKAQN